MNNKGQYSIIAALLVAVILIATVIVTYSTIRNTQTQVQPQILSTIDETNLALKEILGFTVGYYGSALQVTGNSSYARELAINYTKSGLENIARMRPELGASFNLSTVDLSVYWYTNKSWSTGRLVVDYNLTGLGLYGMTYETSCKLTVQVKGTTLSNQTTLVVTKDEGEPLINLERQNFKFYRYIYENSTWALINPSAELEAYANGTYKITVPSEIDPYSYLIQVEDPRGVIVVASSFSRYTCTLNWNYTMYPQTGVVNMTLIDHESFEGTWPPSGWSETGNWNKESTRAYSGTYSADFDGDGSGTSGDLTTPYLNCYGATAIYVDFWYMDGGGCDTNEFRLQYYDGDEWDIITDFGPTAPNDEWLHYQQVITDSQYFKSNFRIRWSAYDVEDGEHAYVDYVTITVNKQEMPMTIVVELLQNGTMRWLGQNLTTQAKPIPPIPVKALHVNQTINGLNQEVPFQIEDWASDYKIPLGLTGNASIFGNRHMIVFLVNSNVSKVTIWWNGSDTATQTPLAYTNKHFSYTFGDQLHPITLNNGILELAIDFSGDGSFKAISTMGGATSTATLMRVNQDTADYGYSIPMYAVLDGTVRAVIHHEVEWGGGGVSGCPNFYAHIVLTLPANATYYTYQLRFMFINSSRSRTITDLCILRLSYSSGQPLTENGTANGYPTVSSATGLFYNFSASCWQHHWSQLNSSLTRGAGIMFTDAANRMLYRFDTIAGSTTGALDIASGEIRLRPVTHRASASFTYPLDLIWYGAVATFDGTTPIYASNGGGLWITVEYPPTITVTTET